MTEGTNAAEAAPSTPLKSTPQKNKDPASDLEEVVGTVVRKNRAFKRIRGFLNGESRRERRARKEAKKKNKKKSGNVSDDDQDTIFDVNVEERSVVSRLTDASGKAEGLLGPMASSDAKDDEGYLLKVVLLLMDPKTRRFELLQLEFDSLKALVSDVLAQIPISVTEEALRLQTYTGICGRAGKEMAPEKLLATFCEGNEVLVAIPAGVEAQECARLARPILSDAKVMQMLRSSGIDTSSWKDDGKAKEKSLPSSSSAKEADVAVSSPETTSSNVTLWIFLVILIGLGLQMFHLYISAPIDPDHVVSPGTWLSKCGLLSFLPSCEENAFLNVDTEGKVTLFDADQDMVWQMTGEVCPEDSEGCIAGMQVQEDGKIFVGGKQVHYVIMYKEDAQLTPWPFEEKPQVRIWKK